MMKVSYLYTRKGRCAFEPFARGTGSIDIAVTPVGAIIVKAWEVQGDHGFDHLRFSFVQFGLEPEIFTE
jgi:hypothetical protein